MTAASAWEHPCWAEADAASVATAPCRNCRYDHIDAGCGSYAPVSHAESLFFRAAYAEASAAEV